MKFSTKKIYWRNPEWKIAFFVQLFFEVLQSSEQTLNPIFFFVIRLNDGLNVFIFCGVC